jgi:predicted RNA-binding Zn-ribbon protein involved in translation (DUF1610 family)
MDPDHEAVECPACQTQFQLDRAVEEFTCPNCEHRFTVRRGEGTRIIEDAGGNCSVLTLAALVMVLILVLLLGRTGRAVYPDYGVTGSMTA